MKEGVEAFVLRSVIGWSPLKKLLLFLFKPVNCWIAFVATTLAWHTPVMFELALRSELWHAVEHICFLVTALLFWWPVIQPWPSRARWSRWTMIPYLLLADLQNTALSAFLIFYDRVVYPTYAAAPRIFGMSALEDQAAAGAIMWVPGSCAFLISLIFISIAMMSPSRRSAQASDACVALPIRFAASGKDLARTKDAKPAPDPDPGTVSSENSGNIFNFAPLLLAREIFLRVFS